MCATPIPQNNNPTEGSRPAKEALAAEYRQNFHRAVKAHQLESALDFVQKEEFIRIELQHTEERLVCCCNRIAVRQMQEDNAQALAEAEKIIEFCASGDYPKIEAACYGNAANALCAMGQTAAALEMHAKEVKLLESLGNVQALARSYGNQAGIHQMSGNIAKAEELLLKQEKISSDCGDMESLAACLSQQAMLAARVQDSARVSALRQREIEVLQKSGDTRGQARLLSGQALDLMRDGALEQALSLFRQEEELRRSISDCGIMNTYGNMGVVLIELQRPAEAIPLLEQQRTMAQAAEHAAEEAAALGNLAVAWAQEGNRTLAKAMLDEELRIRQLIDDDASLSNCYANQAALSYEDGDNVLALEYLQKEYSTRQTLGDSLGEIGCLGNMATLAIALERYQDAEFYYQREQMLCEGLGDTLSLALSYGKHALLLAQQDKNEGARIYLDREEVLLRELQEHDRLIDTLMNSAGLHSRLQEFQKAHRCLSEAHGYIDKPDDPRRLEIREMLIKIESNPTFKLNLLVEQKAS